MRKVRSLMILINASLLTLFVLASLLDCVTLGAGFREDLLSVRGVTHYMLDLKR